MLFNSFAFFLFLPSTVAIYSALPRRSRNGFLLLASYVFYGYWDWRFLGLIMASTGVDYVVARRLHETTLASSRRRLLLTSVGFNLGVLGLFKYYDFFAGSLAAAAAAAGITVDSVTLHIVLPVGISFYTFQTLSYTIDVYRKRVAPATSVVDFALFVAFFPQLVAGPIERAERLLPQIEASRTPDRHDFSVGMALITEGMLKKVLIGDACGRFVDHIFGAPGQYAASEILAALALFSIQIYADFSGYSSIARGSARLLGIELIENFRQPYLATSITDFWARWHVSLSSWLRDYLYIPLGGNRRGEARRRVNLMITMLLGGLWHGASWSFVVWGALHGIALSLHKLSRERNGNPTSPLGLLVGWVVTQSMVMFAWIFFRAPTLEDATLILGRIVSWQTAEFDLTLLTIVATFASASLCLDAFARRDRGRPFLLRFAPAPRLGISIVVWSVIVAFMVQNKPMPFIYFQF